MHLSETDVYIDSEAVDSFCWADKMKMKVYVGARVCKNYMSLGAESIWSVLLPALIFWVL